MVFDGLIEKFDIENVSNLFLLIQHSTLEEALESEVCGSCNLIKKKKFVVRLLSCCAIKTN